MADESYLRHRGTRVPIKAKKALEEVQRAVAYFDLAVQEPDRRHRSDLLERAWQILDRLDRTDFQFTNQPRPTDVRTTQ